MKIRPGEMILSTWAEPSFPVRPYGPIIYLAAPANWPVI